MSSDKKDEKTDPLHTRITYLYVIAHIDTIKNRLSNTVKDAANDYQTGAYSLYIGQRESRLMNL